jgi:rhodanese-related sulfurtransferase
MKILLAICALTVLSLVHPTLAADSPAAVKHVDAAGAEKLLAENKSVLVLDIRTAKEFAAGRIAGAKNLDYYATDFEKQLGELDRAKPILVHCASGGRSGRSLDLFKKLKFQTVYHLDGGFNAWQRSGRPVQN